jgi:hypothetical protein
MTRHIVPLTCIALFSAAVVACNRPGATEQQREDNAGERAANARNEAERKAQGAQVSAEKDIAAAQSEFEKSREDYRHSRMIDLADLDKKMVDLEADAKTATGKTKADLEARLPAIHARRDSFVRDFQALDGATPATWDRAKTNVDKEWDSLKATVDSAR